VGQEPEPAAEAEQDRVVGHLPAGQLQLINVIDNPYIISRVEFSPDGRNLAAMAGASLIIFDATTGAVEWKVPAKEEERGTDLSWAPDGGRIAVCTKHGVYVYQPASRSLVWSKMSASFDGASWSPAGDLIAVGGDSGVVTLLDPGTGKAVAALKGHRGSVAEFAWSSDGRYLASGGGATGGKEYDRGIRIWDVAARSLLVNLEGHTTYVADLAWSPSSAMLVSVSGDDTIRVWDPAGGKLTYSIEVHTGEVRGVAFSPDEQIFATSSWDDSLRFWRTTDLHQLGTVRFSPNRKQLYDRVAFSPDGKLLCATRSKTIFLFGVNVPALAGATTDSESIHYTTAKLVLVGDSGVGKTGLGWRVSHSEFREQSSTHGQQFWVVETLGTTRQDGTECDAVLWDLAGQHVYRPVHAIFLEKVDLALLVFDPTNRQDSLKGVEFWLDQLAGTGALPPTVLIGGRVDRGASVISGQELREFCRQRGITGGYIGTSARTGEGIEQLVETVRQMIPWQDVTATITTTTFKRIKDFVLALKEETGRRALLADADQLRRELMAADPGWSFGAEELMTAIGHLENHGYVTILTNSPGGRFILLEPSILPDLASSIILQADKNPRDLGALSETLLLRDGYPFPELIALDQPEREILIDATVVRFLRHNVCFRETLGAETLLIFPGLIKQKRPLHDEVEIFDDMSYLIRGKVENAYAAIAVLLGYTQAFTRVTQWQGQAQYEFDADQICGFRMRQERESELEFILYYSAQTPAYSRSLFQGLFEKFLHERDVTVQRFPPLSCPDGHRQERALVVQRMREGKDFVFCGECGQKVTLPDASDPQTAASGILHQVRRQELLARLRSSYEANLARIKAYRREDAAPRCYLYFPPSTQAWAAELRQDLRDAGAELIAEPTEVTSGDVVLIVYAPGRGIRRDSAAVGEHIAPLLLGPGRAWADRPAVMTLVLEGDVPASSAERQASDLTFDFRDESRYVLTLYDLMLALYAIPADYAAFAALRDEMAAQWHETATALKKPAPVVIPAPDAPQVFISYAWADDSNKIATELELAFQAEGIHVVRDKHDLGYKGSIREFMAGIGRGRCVLLIISDEYLKSENCLFELLEVARHGDLANRVFPVVLENAQIFKPIDRIRYVQYWEEQVAGLDDALKGVSSANMQGFRDEIDLYVQIRAALPQLTAILRDINALTPGVHRESGYQRIIQAVRRRLGL
jgi:small GTP-binding protein